MGRRLTAVPAELAELAELISARLQLSALTATPILSSGYEDERYNNRLVLRLDVRPEAAALVSADETEVFDDDFALLVRLEEETGSAFADDDVGYSWDSYLGETGICHYLLDEDRLALVAAAAARLPVVEAAARTLLIEQLESA